MITVAATVAYVAVGVVLTRWLYQNRRGPWYDAKRSDSYSEAAFIGIIHAAAWPITAVAFAVLAVGRLVIGPRR